MLKEWVVQLVALAIFSLNSLIVVEHEGVSISKDFGVDFFFLSYHLLLFLFVNYYLIPRFFYPKKYFLFFIGIIGSIILCGIIEEGVFEKILTPDSRGANDITWQSIYWFFGEIIIPLLTFMTIKFVFDNFSQKQKLENIQQLKKE